MTESLLGPVLDNTHNNSTDSSLSHSACDIINDAEFETHMPQSGSSSMTDVAVAIGLTLRATNLSKALTACREPLYGTGLGTVVMWPYHDESATMFPNKLLRRIRTCESFRKRIASLGHALWHIKCCHSSVSPVHARVSTTHARASLLYRRGQQARHHEGSFIASKGHAFPVSPKYRGI